MDGARVTMLLELHAGRLRMGATANACSGQACRYGSAAWHKAMRRLSLHFRLEHALVGGHVRGGICMNSGSEER